MPGDRHERVACAAEAGRRHRRAQAAGLGAGAKNGVFGTFNWDDQTAR